MNEWNVSVLMYADNTALVDLDPVILQRIINRLKIYCNSQGLKVSIEKSKIIIFSRGSRQTTHEKWSFSNNQVEIVKNYKYLGGYIYAKVII